MSRPGATNFYASIGSKYVAKQQTYKNYDNVRISIPNRMIIVGSGGSGKTNILMNMIKDMACWTKIYLFVKCPGEPLYSWLIDECRKIEALTGKELIFVSSTLDDLPTVDEFPKERVLCVFDDMLQSNPKDMERMTELWVRGRKHGCDVSPKAHGITPVFISQSYFGVPKTIRSNSDIVIFKKLTMRDLNLVLQEFASEKTKEELRDMYKRCDTGDICNFFMIDTSSAQDPRYKYRHNYEPLE